MFFKGIIIDLDNTLYNYDICHKEGLKQCFSYLNLDNKLLENKYNKIYKSHKYETINTASSHNKNIYIKQLFENLNINFSLYDDCVNIYWSNFYKEMKLNNGVNDFLKYNKMKNIKLGILTNYETEFQIKKLKILNILDYIDVIVTSEEVGIEKPSKQMFLTILDKMNLTKDEVIMVGDSFEQDIKGALNMNIFSYWFHKNNNNYDNYIEFNDFNKLYIEWKNMYDCIYNLCKISKYCGERFDLVQAGGGNSSVKINNYMFIKASGYNMSEIKNGLVTINNKKLKTDIMNNDVKEIIHYNVLGKKRGSIETYMHSILKKYVIHLHPIQVIKILIQKDAETILKKLFPDSLIIEYLTPGIKVCNKIKELYNNEEIIFLINHGIIITTNDYDKINFHIENILNKCENFLNENFDIYKYVNIITKFVYDKYNLEYVSYLSQDIIINKYLNSKLYLFKENITFPDALIYCGIKIIFIENIEDIDNYYKSYSEVPKIIINNNNIYITSISLKKCKEIEDVLKANLCILDNSNEKNYLSNKEICYLNNWDAEKYRKNI
jgi:FMN phosphatase YigB (HAD superfamily)